MTTENDALKQGDSDPMPGQRGELEKEVRMFTEFHDFGDEGSILLAAMLGEFSDTAEAVAWLQFLEQCCFMSTFKFREAFQAYRQQVLDLHKGGEADEK